VPSPIAHSLIGLAIGVAALRPRGKPARVTLRTRALPLLGFAALANAPDLDFVPGLLAGDLNRYHHGPSHSMLWALGFALWAGLLARWGGDLAATLRDQGITGRDGAEIDHNRIIFLFLHRLTRRVRPTLFPDGAGCARQGRANSPSEPRPRKGGPPLQKRIISRAGWAAAAAAVLSHLVADVLCQDRSPPFGIPLWWPITDAPVLCPWPLFLAMEKTDLAAVFSAANLVPALRETAIGGALLAGAWAWTGRRPRAAAAPGAGP
jgi:hypothetical protein